MKLSDVAKEFNANIEELVQYYKEKCGIDLPVDENYILSFEEVRKSIPLFPKEKYYKYAETEEPKKQPKVEEEIIIKLPEKEEEFLNPESSFNKTSIKKYFKWSEQKLTEKILDHNQIDELVLQGIYEPDVNGGNFGFFNEVRHINGYYLDYPHALGNIESVFIFPSKLEGDKEYTFEAQIAPLKNRKKKNNPFLLQAKRNSTNQIKQLSELQTIIDEKQVHLEKIQTEISNIETELTTEKEKVIEQVNKLKSEKQSEANEIIEEYNVQIQDKFNLIEEKSNELKNITDECLINSQKLNELNIIKSDMEASIEFLKKKIELCKNLEFISDNDANKYLNTLAENTYETPEGFLDMENDFNNHYTDLAEHIQLYLYQKKGLIYTQFQIQNFLSLIMTHDIIVLSGLSGSGKTQIVKSFAEAVGGVAKIIPVKPNWTSSDDLLGYYNPIQSSFLPTPFTEAIVEASLNPNQLYFICLDEMNLARPEYYFADFLSKLEEREESPEIELYAKHEEELFISEFGTLLSLIENAVGGNEIKSWQDFLSKDSIRSRFFELLGSSNEETMLKIHSQMKRRLIDILKFPATIKIPNNIRFIGAINVDETTNYFSPKILDRVHVVKFENPLLIENIVKEEVEGKEYARELKPVYVEPSKFGKREELPPLNNEECKEITNFLKEINQKYLLDLSIDFGVRSIRQAINYSLQYFKTGNNDGDKKEIIAINTILNQKILPRFVFDANESLKNGETKLELLKRLSEQIKEELLPLNDDESLFNAGYLATAYLDDLINYAESNNGQINFYA